MLLFGLPIAVAVSYGFHRVAERPFLSLNQTRPAGDSRPLAKPRRGRFDGERGISTVPSMRQAAFRLALAHAAEPPARLLGLGRAVVDEAPPRTTWVTCVVYSNGSPS